MAQQMLHRMPVRRLLALLVAALVLVTCSAHLDSKDMRQQMRTRIQGHQQFSELMRNAEAAVPQAPELSSERDPARASRMMQATPATIRIYPEYQLSSSLSASAQATIKAVVTSAIATLQGYLQVRKPVGSGGLLAVPQLVSTALCNNINSNPSAYPGQTCSAPGWYPTFGTNLATTDVKYPSCGPGTINPAHMLSTSCINTQTGAITCQTSASGATGGLQTDVYIYVTSDQSSCPTNVAAYALPCFYDLTTNRPVMGALNLCSIAITGYTTDKLLATVTHEITHSLGFTNDLFGFYINPSTNTALGASNVMSTVAPTGSPAFRNNYSMVITPTVVREVRAQFGCNTLAGAALEDQGGSGSANSHWEYELFQGELMTPTKPADSGNQRYSRLTLALLEDSGWYVGNWTAAAYLDWGRNAGCNMPLQTCSAYQSSTAGQPFFCPNPGTQIDTCNFDGVSHGYCALNPTFATCGIINTLSAPGTSNPTVVQPSCISSYYTNAGASVDAAGKQAFGWSIGASSRCLGTSLPLSSTNPSLNLQSQSGSSTIGICWTASCTSGGALTYNVAGQTITCPPGNTIALSSLSSNIQQGAVTCPQSAQQAQSVCRTLQCPASGCNDPGGNCFEGQCVCRLGNTGADCSNDLFLAALAAGGTPLPTAPAAAPGTSPAGPVNQGAGGPGPSGPGISGGPSTSPAADTGSGGLSGTTLMIVIIVASVVGGIVVIAIVGVIIAATASGKVNPRGGSSPAAAAAGGGPGNGNAGIVPSRMQGAVPGYGAAGPQPGGAEPPELYPSYAPPTYASPGYNAAPPVQQPGHYPRQAHPSYL